MLVSVDYQERLTQRIWVPVVVTNFRIPSPFVMIAAAAAALVVSANTPRSVSGAMV